MAAIEKLQPQQKELLIRVYWNKELQKDIAAEEGVSEMAISGRMKRIINSLKKNFKIGGLFFRFSWLIYRGLNFTLCCSLKIE